MILNSVRGFFKYAGLFFVCVCGQIDCASVFCFCASVFCSTKWYCQDGFHVQWKVESDTSIDSSPVIFDIMSGCFFLAWRCKVCLFNRLTSCNLGIQLLYYQLVRFYTARKDRCRCSRSIYADSCFCEKCPELISWMVLNFFGGFSNGYLERQLLGRGGSFLLTRPIVEAIATWE